MLLFQKHFSTNAECVTQRYAFTSHPFTEALTFRILGTFFSCLSIGILFKLWIIQFVETSALYQTCTREKKKARVGLCSKTSNLPATSMRLITASRVCILVMANSPSIKGSLETFLHDKAFGNNVVLKHFLLWSLISTPVSSFSCINTSFVELPYEPDHETDPG